MAEERVGLLWTIASTLSSSNQTLKLLRSSYLMRCNELVKGFGRPMKNFSSKTRCPHCCIEWTKDAEVKFRPIKLSKSQRRKLKSKKNAKHDRNSVEKKSLLHSKEMIQICTFCKQSTTTKLIKPDKEYIRFRPSKNENCILKENNQKKLDIVKATKKTAIVKTGMAATKKDKIKTNNNVINLYTNAIDVFSLKNKKNTISSAIKEPAKVIKNNKKKKDKFAGLCQKAVLASAKIKEQKVTQKNDISQNKLNLFLKPSS